MKPDFRLPAFALVLGLAGCSALPLSPSAPKAEISTLQLETDAAPSAVSQAVLQVQVMRFADSYVSAVP